MAKPSCVQYSVAVFPTSIGSKDGDLPTGFTPSYITARAGPRGLQSLDACSLEKIFVRALLYLADLHMPSF